MFGFRIENNFEINKSYSEKHISLLKSINYKKINGNLGNKKYVIRYLIFVDSVK